MKILKIIFINLLILFTLLIIIEFFGRSIWTLRSCLKFENCDFKRVINLKIRDDSFLDQNIGLTKYDPLLGYIPNSGFDKKIIAHGWNNKKITISKNGFRSNDNTIYLDKKILVTGDSFTFGDQVSNKNTWPSCLERTSKIGVANAGVYGYGAAQSLKRAKIESKKKQYDYLILSILVNSNFSRDQLIYRSGFPRPAVVKTKNVIQWASVPNGDDLGSKFGKSDLSIIQNIIQFAFKYSQVVGTIIDKFFPWYDFTGKRLTIEHTEAATINDIMKFTLNEFYKIPIKNKYILLQFGSRDFENNNSSILMSINELKSIAKSLDIFIIDTYSLIKDELKTNNRENIWFKEGHHKPFGNSLICKEIFKEINF